MTAHSRANGFPTLAEAIDAVRGRIKLNIELKRTKSHRERWPQAVAALIQAKSFEADCFVTSLDRQAVEAAPATTPSLRTGAIISAAVGDIARLDVAVLSVRTGLVTQALLDEAHNAGREVHAWTIDDRSGSDVTADRPRSRWHHHQRAGPRASQSDRSEKGFLTGNGSS